MKTNINNAKQNISNDNQINTDINSTDKIKIKKALFNINDENTKYTNLDLEVINSWNLPKGLKLHINKIRSVIFRPVNSKNYNREKCQIINTPAEHEITAGNALSNASFFL